MTTDAFIIGLRSFIAIRGAVSIIKCDQGTNFIGADNKLKLSLSKLDAESITAFLTKKQCQFVFNAPYASHAGGVWERQIRSIKNILITTASLVHGRLDDSSLRCLFYEAMLIINSRPLSPSNDPFEEPLTPNHLVTMKPVQPVPPPSTFVKEDLYARKRWRRIQYLAEQFWCRWRREYLLNLSARQKWMIPRRNFQVGDVVVIVDDSVLRMNWPLCIVSEANPGNDGLLRRVKVRVGTKELNNQGIPKKNCSVLERPVQKIVVILPLNGE